MHSSAFHKTSSTLVSPHNTITLSKKLAIFRKHRRLAFPESRSRGKFQKYCSLFQLKWNPRLALNSGDLDTRSRRLGDLATHTRVRHGRGCRCVNNNKKRECQKCRVFCVW
uniref:(northern house mosquito) hypothetical protein n=1 Tax=Culex pipiens TaxID=7175 RepID=A0A8D8HY67_CULPI